MLIKISNLNNSNNNNFKLNLNSEHQYNHKIYVLLSIIIEIHNKKDK